MNRHEQTYQTKLLDVPPSLPTAQFGTFSDNHQQPVHRWYPFVEGYSHNMFELAMAETKQQSPHVHDPFAGSGTTCLAASVRGLASSFCEVNPFMAWVTATKLNQVPRCVGQGHVLHELADGMQATLPTLAFDPPTHPLLAINKARSFYSDQVVNQIVAYLAHVNQNLDGPLRDLALMAFARCAVSVSNMVRRADLGRRRPQDPVPLEFLPTLVGNLHMIAADLDSGINVPLKASRHLCGDVRTLRPPSELSPFDLIVTSPPYLNGTNYFRNTKLELFALGFLETEAGLGDLRSRSITAAINNVSKRRDAPMRLDVVEPVATAMDAAAYDVRIPSMLRLYFADMHKAFERLRQASSGNAKMYLDIGDSQFCGVHVPTDELLCKVAAMVGWELYETVPIRDRRSYDGSPLRQVLLKFAAV